MSADDVAFSSDYDEFDHVLETSTTLVISGTVAGGATRTWSTTIDHPEFSDVFSQLYTSQSASGYTGYEEPTPPLDYIYVAATGTGVPSAGAQAFINADNDGTTTTITIYVNNPSGSTWTITSNTLTFRYMVTDAPWQ